MCWARAALRSAALSALRPGSTDVATRDALFCGRLAVRQLPRGAYRTNVDALLLAAFAAERHRRAPARLVADLGAGVGAVGLALLHFGVARRVLLVEIDAAAAAIAGANLAANGWAERGDVFEGDVADARRTHAASADLVVCNPPYVEPGRGRLAAVPSRARARSGELSTFTQAARALLGRRGRACFVYPAPDLASLTATLRASGLEPKRLRFVHATERSPARVALVEAAPAKPGGLAVLPPLIERAGAGSELTYGAELAALLGGELPASPTDR